MTRSVHVVLPAASCKTTCLSAVVLLVEVACTPVFFVMGHASRVYSNSLYVIGVWSLLSVFCGVLVRGRWSSLADRSGPYAHMYTLMALHYVLCMSRE